MAAPTVIFRGLAGVEGVAGTHAALVALKQGIKGTQNWEEEVIKDEHGYDAAWLMRNEKHEVDITVKIMASTVAASIAPAVAQSPGASTTATVSAMLQPYYAPGSVIVLSAFTLTSLNGAFRILSGTDFTLKNDGVAEATFKICRYANADQQTAAGTTPS